MSYMRTSRRTVRRKIDLRWESEDTVVVNRVPECVPSVQPPTSTKLLSARPQNPFRWRGWLVVPQRLVGWYTLPPSKRDLRWIQSMAIFRTASPTSIFCRIVPTAATVGDDLRAMIYKSIANPDVGLTGLRSRMWPLLLDLRQTLDHAHLSPPGGGDLSPNATPVPLTASFRPRSRFTSAVLHM